MAVASVLALLAWWAGCGPLGRGVHAYGFIFHETTGITTFLLVNGKEQAVQFTPQSSRLARETLFDLDAFHLYKNADGHHIVVEGVLDAETRWTPSGPGLPSSEPYRDFTLRFWHPAWSSAPDARKW